MKIKIDSEQLRLGMYVSELDRPWVESPFLFQGFPLSTAEELEQVQALCRYVYIDTEKTPFDVRPHLIAGATSRQADKTTSSRDSNFADTVTFKSGGLEKADFKANLIKARQTRDKTHSYITNVLEDVRLGKSFDTQQAKDLVASLAENIVGNPDASMWLTSLKNRDEYTAIHSVNVCVLSLTFGRALGLTSDELNELGLGALLHDIGKMKTPLEVLNKPGRLTKEEFELMKAHPVEGHQLLYKDKLMTPGALDIVLSHHERINGSGYPKGQTAEEIQYFTKIVSITDVYDAITSDRVYHDGMTPHEGLKKMYDWMPDNFDEPLMQAFIRTIGIYPVGSVVEFNTGHIGIIVKLNEEQKLKPVVMMLMNRNKEYYPKRKLINLASPMWQGNKDIPVIQRIVDAKEFNIDVKQIINEESQSH